MSKLKVSGNASGTGVITLEAPNTNTDRAITLPDSAGELINIAPSTSGNVLTSDGTDWTSAAGGADTSLSNLSATGENKVCQAWVNFDGTGTVAIISSYNVSSITDNGTGDWSIHITNALASASFCVSTGFSRAATNDFVHAYPGYFTTTRFRLQFYSSGSSTDTDGLFAQVFGD